MAHPRLQAFLPQRLLSTLAGWLADSTIPWLKKRLIAYFLKRHPVNLAEALESDPGQYPSFNAFFTRLLKPATRPITPGPCDLACPADGLISEWGRIEQGQLLQAKGRLFSLEQLVGASLNNTIATAASHFKMGSFMTVYLAPHHYHRVHMPIDARLRHMVSIPGRLFSVNFQTATQIPNLFAQNERLVCFFESSQGPLVMVLVGAMLVGSIETTWAGCIRSTQIQYFTYASPIDFKRGEEMGLFKMGSTVITLFSNPMNIDWETFSPKAELLIGQKIGTLRS